MSFILDTGASYTLLFGLKDSLLLKKSKKIRLYGIGSGKYLPGLTIEHLNMRIVNAVNPNIKLYVVPADTFDIVRLTGETIHGIIGYDFFKDFIVDIHYKKRIIKITNPSHYRKPGKKYKELPLHVEDKKAYLDTRILQQHGDTLPAKMLIDTGNSDAIWLFEDELIKLEKDQKYFPDFLGESISGSILGKRTRLKYFSLAGYEFLNLTVAYLDSSMTYKTRINSKRKGSLGSQILQRFRPIFDYPGRRLFLKKNASFNKDFRYNRTGINLIYAGKTLVGTQHIKPKSVPYEPNKKDSNFNIQIEYSYELKPLYVIHYIRPDSPADKLGLRPGDVLVSINNRQAYNFSLEKINQLFHGDEGDEIHIKVMRNGVPMDALIILKKLL
jgi:hypothetical protein